MGMLKSGSLHSSSCNRIDHRRGLIGVAVVCGGLLALVAQLSAPGDYNWLNRTLSELAVARYERAWIMRLSMASFGVLLLCGLLLDLSTGRRAQPVAGARRTGPAAALAVYALAVVFCAVWPVAPVGPVVATGREIAHGEWHSVASIVMIAGLSGTILWSYALETAPGARLAHLATLVLVAGTSLAFGLASLRVLPSGQGLFQRAMQILGAAWILYAHTATARQAPGVPGRGGFGMIRNDP